jgi:uncharacterized protein with PCYCGC motif
MTCTSHTNRTRRRCSRRAVLSAPLVLGIATLVGCSSAKKSPNTPDNPYKAWPSENRWPAQFLSAPADVQEAYRYAVVNHDVLQYIPCFCGCVESGHTSNFDCYVAAQGPDGSIILDPMSYG